MGRLDGMACKVNKPPFAFCSVCNVAWRYGMPATLFVCQVTVMYTCIEKEVLLIYLQCFQRVPQIRVYVGGAYNSTNTID
jgi:hypothetical protein